MYICYKEQPTFVVINSLQSESLYRRNSALIVTAATMTSEHERAQLQVIDAFTDYCGKNWCTAQTLVTPLHLKARIPSRKVECKASDNFAGPSTVALACNDYGMKVDHTSRLISLKPSTADTYWDKQTLQACATVHTVQTSFSLFLSLSNLPPSQISIHLTKGKESQGRERGEPSIRRRTTGVKNGPLDIRFGGRWRRN